MATDAFESKELNDPDVCDCCGRDSEFQCDRCGMWLCTACEPGHDESCKE
jgi:hypothetical protein